MVLILIKLPQLFMAVMKLPHVVVMMILKKIVNGTFLLFVFVQFVIDGTFLSSPVSSPPYSVCR